MAPLTAILIFGCALLGSEAQPRREERVLPDLWERLEPGMNEERVEQLLGFRGGHQFTALISNHTVRCLSYYRKDARGRYYLVFTNGHLASMCVPPEFEMRRVPYGGTWLYERVIGDPEIRVGKVLAATNLLGSKLPATLGSQAPSKYSWDPGLTAAFLLVQRSANKAKQAQREKEYLILLEKFDPTKVELGATVAEVEKRLGKPHIVETSQTGEEKRYYGSVEFGMMASREMMWLTVVYREGKVIRVFSHDFLDQSKIKALEERVK